MYALLISANSEANLSGFGLHVVYVKQPDNKLIDVERTCLDRLKRWEPPDTDLGEDDVSEATKQLHFLRTVIRSLLT